MNPGPLGAKRIRSSVLRGPPISDPLNSFCADLLHLAPFLISDRVLSLILSRDYEFVLARVDVEFLVLEV